MSSIFPLAGNFSHNVFKLLEGSYNANASVTSRGDVQMYLNVYFAANVLHTVGGNINIFSSIVEKKRSCGVGS